MEVLTGFQWILCILLSFACLQYIWLIWDDKYSVKKSGLKEGFQSGAMTESDKTRVVWFENEELYDEFYSTVYDSLTQLAGRYPQEITLIMHQW